MIIRAHPKLNIQRQCELLSIHRSGLYYQPKKTSKLNGKLMRLIDEQYLQRPFYTVYCIGKWLVGSKGYAVNINRVRRLFRPIGLEAIGPKTNTSKPTPGHIVYPFLPQKRLSRKKTPVATADLSRAIEPNWMSVKMQQLTSALLLMMPE